jgi:hypothetical protein
MSLARRRARGELGEIRLQDLSFTEDETSALVNNNLGLDLTSQEVHQLHSRTEGWAAGVRLLATSLSQLPANRTTLLSGMQGSRRIFDFLAKEVLDRQEPDLRNFLLDTSILSSLRPEVCDALTGRRDSGRILEDLYQRNLYVVAADEAKPVSATMTRSPTFRSVFAGNGGRFGSLLASRSRRNLATSAHCYRPKAGMPPRPRSHRLVRIRPPRLRRDPSTLDRGVPRRDSSALSEGTHLLGHAI